MDANFLQKKHLAGLAYEFYVQSGTPAQQDNWRKAYDSTHLGAVHTRLLRSFVRRINVIGLSGIWCGDCVQQCPLVAKIAAGSALIDLRFLDRDEHKDLQKHVRINGGDRVPVFLFCSEDYELAGWFGDRTLSRYRALAKSLLGPSCPLPGATVDPDESAATVHDWVDQFERIHLMLRLSTRLRQLHRD